MDDFQENEQDWNEKIEGAADLMNDDSRQQEEQRLSSSHRKKHKPKHHKKKKKKRHHDERTSLKEESIEGEQTPPVAGVASLPSIKTHENMDATRGNDNDSSFTNLLVTLSDQQDAVPPKGMINIFYSSVPCVHSSLTNYAYRRHHSIQPTARRHTINKEFKTSTVS